MSRATRILVSLLLSSPSTLENLIGVSWEGASSYFRLRLSMVYENRYYIRVLLSVGGGGIFHDLYWCHHGPEEIILFGSDLYPVSLDNKNSCPLSVVLYLRFPHWCIEPIQVFHLLVMLWDFMFDVIGLLRNAVLLSIIL